MSSDMDGLIGSILLLCLISLTTANSSPTINQFLYNLCEDTPEGSFAFKIAATDADGDPLTFTLTGASAIYFTVQSSTGDVTVARRLDYETTPLLQLTVIVSDERNPPVTGDLNIVLGDANDNRPLFQESSYDRTVPENTPAGTSLFTARATDADTGSAGIINYSIDEVIPNDGFSLFSIVSTTGEVRLSGSLNYNSLSTFYRLRINASDLGGNCYFPETTYLSSITYSFITVEDVPDLDPRFIGIPYVETVEENSPVDTSVLKVTALDQDTGVNDEIIYSIEDSTADGLFKISSSEGVISVLSAIDREVIGDTVTLTVKATESKTNISGIQASTTANVQISILDVNDQKPEFYKCGNSEDECVKATQFIGDALEHSLGSINIDMTVKDLDKISHTELILEGEDKDVFSLQPQSTMSDSSVQLLVRQPEKMDFEKIQQMILQVIAIDKDEPSFRSTAEVTINIKDDNDNSPTFKEDTYRLNVEEHSDNGTVLATITADDPDTMDQGNLTYKLLPESILPYFDVEPHTGAVYVKNSSLLDREVRSLYTATLQAKDTGGKPGTTVLEITLIDINDQHPIFNRDSYLEFVKEGEQLELRVEATDADEPNTLNSQIVYGIMPNTYSANFTIDPSTGVLRNSGILDREALDPDLRGRIELNVTATDKGAPSLSSMATVTINVEDIDDNTPQFAAPTYNFSVKEGEQGAFVGSVQAEDLDQTVEFNRISFNIIDGSFGSFIIRTFPETKGYRGNITVDPDIELDYESAHQQFSLRVEAADLEQNKAVVMVVVDVLDVNDERPEFTPTAPLKVKENTTLGDAVGRFSAHDKDGNHSLVFELDSVKCRCKSELEPCDWFILDPTGEVRVNPEITVDYEECVQAIVEAWVVDVYTEKGENSSITTGQMEINIEDINDNAPEFHPSDAVFVVVSESASKGTEVARITGTDRDSGINSNFEFKVTGVKFQHIDNQTTVQRLLFQAVTTQQNDIHVGLIQTTEGLDMTLKGKYLVTITATDTGGLSSSTVREIFTIDESYKVELRFDSSESEVENKLGQIKSALIAATGADVQIVALRPDTSQTSRNSVKTIVVAYFVYPNGTALTSNQVEIKLSDPEHYPSLIQLGLVNISDAPVQEKEVNPLLYILMGIVGGLVVVLAILATSLLCTRRTYKTKLKAAEAMKSATMVTSDNQKGGPVVPGTNKYTMEGANPVLNLNIDTSIGLDLDGDSSDVDKVSLNSLVYEEIVDEKRTKLNKNMIQEEDEDDQPPEYIEPLGAALAQVNQSRSTNNPLMGLSNPVFGTTDL